MELDQQALRLGVGPPQIGHHRHQVVEQAEVPEHAPSGNRQPDMRITERVL